MRICMLTNMYPHPELPAYGVFVKSQIDSVVELGHDVEVVFINGKKSRFDYAKSIYSLRRLLRCHKFDIVHAHYGLSGIVACLQNTTPVVISFCGDDLLGTPKSSGGTTRVSNLIVSMSRWAGRHAGGIIVKSREMQSCLSDVDRDRAVVIPNGVDMDLFRPHDRSESRARLGLDSDRPYVLFPSTPFELRKRLDLAEAAIERVTEMYQDVELLTIHQMPQENVPIYMSACDAMVMTSDWEGSSNVVKEAMACDLPVVSVNAGDAWEVIEGAANCYRAERHPEDIADKLLHVLASQRRSDGREHVRDLELGRVAERIVAVYESALAVA